MKEGDKLEVITVAQTLEFPIPQLAEHSQADRQAVEHLKGRASTHAEALVARYKQRGAELGVRIIVW